MQTGSCGKRQHLPVWIGADSGKFFACLDKCFALGVASGVAVEEERLAFAREKALVVVRAVQVDEQVAEVAEHGEFAGRAVDELAAGFVYRERAFDDELAVFAWLEACGVE